MEVKYVSDNSTILEKMLRQICLFWGGGIKNKSDFDVNSLL